MPAAHTFDDTDRAGVTAIRTLAMDAVQKANSGHPGAPMGLAPVAYALWQRVMTYDPADPLWPNRDRFVLSNGHASMLQYALIHLAGVKDVDVDGLTVKDEPSLPLDQLQKFRQLGSRTPGHPEHELTAGIETTTGPLGQGCANSVGMAIAQKWVAAHYGRPGFESLFEHRVYAICGDGCMMEGITSEAASLAGHLKLDNLVWLYDDNSITIDGKTSLAFTEDTYARFAAYGWHVVRVADGNDMPAVEAALAEAAATKNPADVHRRQDGHRLRGAQEGRHQGGPRRTARGRGNQGGEDGLRGGPGQELLRAAGGVCRLPGRHGQAGRRGPTPPGTPSWPSTASSSRRKPARSCRCGSGSCPRVGTKTCRCSPRTRRDWPAERAAAPSSTLSPRRCPGWSAGRPT